MTTITSSSALYHIFLYFGETRSICPLPATYVEKRAKCLGTRQSIVFTRHPEAFVMAAPKAAAPPAQNTAETRGETAPR